MGTEPERPLRPQSAKPPVLGPQSSVQSPQPSAAAERRRRRREVVLISVLAVAFAVLAVLQTQLPEFSNSSSLTGNIIFFLLINLNIILLVLLVFLVSRNLAKLIFERRQRIIGARLRTRLVLAFVSLTLFPTLLLFVVAEGFLSGAINSWFDARVQTSLSGALQVAHRYYQELGDDTLHDALEIEREIHGRGLDAAGRRQELRAFVHERRLSLNVAAISIVGADGEALSSHDEALGQRNLRVLPADLATALNDAVEFTRTHKVGAGDVVRGGVPLRGANGEIVGVVVVDRLVPRAISRSARATARSHDEYRQLRVLKQPIVNSYTLTLALITLVVLLAATWFGFTFSRGFAVPIQLLGEGMREVAHGNWDYRAEAGGDEEFATLFSSFNQMTAELRTSHSALEERRRYIERVLSNITGGVVSVDENDRIATVNPAAGSMLAIVPDEVRGAPWRTALERRDLQPVRDLLKQLQIQPERRIERQVKLAAGPRTLTAWVTAMALTDEEGVSRGFILFLEDVSYLLRVERMEAWREVARRIAHEIKNPLTPIQLSAQRLRKRFADELGPEQQAILEECTTTIVGQVDQLKRLVNEFATFARLPAAEIAPKDLGVLADEALVLFREAHPGIDFALTLEPDVPLVEVDEEAIKRAIINLLDNAVAACQAAERPQVVVSVEHHPAMGVVQLQVSDNGPGMTPDVKARVFEPYFSTKKDGTGLGLAIVSAIVSEHQGYVRLFDNEPRGTRVVVEFPTRRRTALRAAIQ